MTTAQEWSPEKRAALSAKMKELWAKRRAKEKQDERKLAAGWTPAKEPKKPAAVKAKPNGKGKPNGMKRGRGKVKVARMVLLTFYTDGSVKKKAL